MSFKEAHRLYNCPHCFKNNFRKIGFYYRKCSKTYIPRYVCQACRKSFSTRTVSPTFGQKRPELNRQIYNYVTGGASFRLTARKLGCHYQTVYRKFLWLSQRAHTIHNTQRFSVNEVQFDEMESIEHTKLKPLTIGLAASDTYQILGIRVGQIPAKGALAKISQKKYGPRPSQSQSILRELLGSLKVEARGGSFVVKSDAKPLYQKVVRETFPYCLHYTHVAQDNKEKRRELKYTNLEKKIYDPIFATNHLMAKARDHLKRLVRRSWCTTKIPANLEKHFYLFIAVQNGYDLI